MNTAKQWRVDIFIDEHKGTTRAEAWLTTGSSTQLKGAGRAKLNPHDVNVPDIGDELAVARALTVLADRLRTAAALDAEGITGESAHFTPKAS